MVQISQLRPKFPNINNKSWMQLKSMNSIVGGLEKLYNAYLVKQNMSTKF